jgi:hypothetical protein
MKKEKRTVIGYMLAEASAYELHKAKKQLRYNEAKEICENLIAIRDELEFSKDFENYLFKEYVLQMSLKGIDKQMFNNLFAADLNKLRTVQKQYECFYNVQLFSSEPPCFDLVITSEFHHSLYYQLLEICKLLNQKPELTKLFFNSTNQFSNCINFCGIKNEVEVSAKWIMQQNQ